MDEIYLNRDRSKEFGVPHFNRNSGVIILPADRVFKLYEAGQWDQRHQDFLQPLAMDHKMMKCEPGSGPGWWQVVEIKNA